MTQLKTLKDLECKGETHGFRPRWICENELRQEAIKWVKDCLHRIKFHDLDKLERRYFWGQLFFIRKFFNLTEEDLSK